MTNRQIYYYIAILVILITQTDIMKGQTRCDTLTDEIFVATNDPPKMDKNIYELEKIVNNSIDLNKYEVNAKEIYVTLTINCHGEDFNYKVLKSDNKEFNRTLTECLMNNINWTPAEHNGKKVDFSYVIPIRIENNRINILDDKEKKKLNKKNKYTTQQGIFLGHHLYHKWCGVLTLCHCSTSAATRKEERHKVICREVV